MVMGDTFTLQDLVKGWKAAKHNSTIGATHPEALRRTPLDIGDKIVMGDTFTLQELVQVSNELELSQT